MSKTIEDITWSEIMPPAIRNDSNAQAMSVAVTPQMQENSKQIKECIILARLDELSETLVDLLAWQYHVDFYDKELLLERKRALVRTSIDVHRHKGTPYAVKTVTSAILNDATIKEWFEYDGEVYHFKVTGVSGELPDSVTIDKLVKAINIAKNTRSWLDGMEFQRAIDSNIYFGGAIQPHKTVNVGLPEFKMPDIFGTQYFSSAHYIHKEVIVSNG